MKWVDHKLDVKGSLLIVLAITSYFILGKGLFEGVLHFLNEYKLWMSGIYVSDFVSYLVILAGFYTILRKMDRAPKPKTLEEENHKHQFYRVVILFVILVVLIIYRKLNLKISIYEVKTVFLLAIGIAMVAIDTLTRRVRKKKQILEGEK